jgi:hypothetical protein
LKKINQNSSFTHILRYENIHFAINANTLHKFKLRNDMPQVKHQNFTFDFVPFNKALPPVLTYWYLDKDTEFVYEDILWTPAALEKSMEDYLKDRKYLSSWSLARMYRLFGDHLIRGLNVALDKQGNLVGCQDGGVFYAEGYILSTLDDNTEEVVGHFYFEGWHTYLSLNLIKCSDNVFPADVINAFTDLIWQAPFDISPCQIIIQDPEQHSKGFHYGWDGSNFFYTED